MADESSDRMPERSERSTLVLLTLLDADRRVLAAGILGVVFLGIVLASFVFPTTTASLRTGDPIETAFQAFVGATITGVTIVVTLNQLVLSQELGALGDQRERMEGALSFRDAVRDLLGETPPAEPSAFLGEMVEATGDRAGAVRDAVDDPSDELRRLLDSTERDAANVTERLSGATFGEYDVVRAALDFNYSWKLYTARRVLADGEYDDATDEALSDLAEALSLFGSAREHFKTLYFQAELIELSRTVLYAAIPSLVATVSVLLFVDISDYSGTLAGVDTGVLLVAAAVAVAVAPFAVLLAYVLRIATVAGRTLAIGPFILRKTDHDTDW